MSIFSDIDDARPEWWAWASCNTGSGEPIADFFPDLGGVPVPDEDSTDEERVEYAMARAAMLEEIERAKAVCAECAVEDLCLAGAVARSEQHGIWGGFNFAVKRERTKARQRLTIAVAAA